MRKWDATGGRRKKSEADYRNDEENRVPIYQGVHEDELDSEGAVEVSPLRKYPILPVRPGAAVPNYRDGMV